MERNEIERLLQHAASFAGLILDRTGNSLDAKRSAELKRRAIEIRTMFEEALKRLLGDNKHRVSIVVEEWKTEFLTRQLPNGMIRRINLGEFEPQDADGLAQALMLACEGLVKAQQTGRNKLKEIS